MPKLRYISRPLIRMVYKTRHHRGHGIHSPFLFALITKVIEEKEHYYAYEDIDDIIKMYSDRQKATKFDRLCFRMVNYFSSKNILEIGATSGIGMLYLTAPSSDIIYHSVCSKVNPTFQDSIKDNWKRCISFHSDLLAINKKQDCIVIDMQELIEDSTCIYNYVSNLIDDETFIILRNIRTNRGANLLWKQLRGDSRTTVSLNLYNIGIVFFNPKLFRRNYIISF